MAAYLGTFLALLCFAFALLCLLACRLRQLCACGNTAAPALAARSTPPPPPAAAPCSRDRPCFYLFVLPWMDVDVGVRALIVWQEERASVGCDVVTS